MFRPHLLANKSGRNVTELTYNKQELCNELVSNFCKYNM